MPIGKAERYGLSHFGVNLVGIKITSVCCLSHNQFRSEKDARIGNSFFHIRYVSLLFVALSFRELYIHCFPINVRFCLMMSRIVHDVSR